MLFASVEIKYIEKSLMELVKRSETPFDVKYIRCHLRWWNCLCLFQVRMRIEYIVKEIGVVCAILLISCVLMILTAVLCMCLVTCVYNVS